MPSTNHRTSTLQPEARLIDREPYYEPIAGEVALFEAAVASRIPVLLKGPTGCGKTRFMEYVAWKLQRPLITVSCHDDLTASDLVGRYLITNHQTRWVDGPLAHAVRVGGICYLDEVVEARKDTTVVIHPLADDRRMLPIEKHGELLRAPDEFVLAMSYNPGYQSVMKELKHSTRQRFVAIEFNYPAEALETKIVAAESGLDAATTSKLLKLAHMTRHLKGNGLDEGASTRLLVHAAKLIQRGIAPRSACHGAIAQALTDDAEMLRAIDELVTSVF
jgi:nitric oxide reductase NorQ protein